MDHFAEKNGTLHAEDVSLSALADTYGTPTYVYSHATIERHVRVLREAMAGLDHIIAYAVKANGNLALLELLVQNGCGLDAVSVGELARALKVGAEPQRIIVSGVGKRDDEIEAALRAGVLYISVESMGELTAVANIAKRIGIKARVSVRVNPEVDAATHPYISTGLRENKFGVPYATARTLYARGMQSPELEMVGVTCHIGSQITTIAPFIDASQKVAELARELIGTGVPLRYIGVGGGLGIPYGDETPPSPAEYGAALAKELGPLKLTVVLEPGRVIIGNAGILLTRVVRVKEGADRLFVIVDAGMNDLIRPALYSAKHRIDVIEKRQGRTDAVTVVGPVCESADTFARDLTMQRVMPGDLLALRSAGAYGFVMSSTYNGRPKPAEVMVEGAKVHVVRARETIAQLWQGETSLSGQAFDATNPLPTGTP